MAQYWKLVALVWLPFVSIFGFAAPALVDRVGDSYPHIVFHGAAAAMLTWAGMVAWRLRSAAAGRTGALAKARRVLLGVAMVPVAAAVLGNVVELLAAVGRLAADGWESRATPDLFTEEGGLHFIASNVTIPALMLSMVLTLTLAVLALAGGRRLEVVARGPGGGDASGP